MRSPKDPYYRHRFPGEIISYCVWLYFRMTVSVQDVEEIMAMRSIAVSYEASRKYGQLFSVKHFCLLTTTSNSLLLPHRKYYLTLFSQRHLPPCWFNDSY